MYIRSMVRPALKIFASFAPSSGAGVVNTSILNCTTLKDNSSPIGGNFTITIEATTGNTWVNPIDNVVATSENSFLLSEGCVLDLKVRNRVSLIGDSTTAKIQAIVWGD